MVSEKLIVIRGVRWERGEMADFRCVKPVLSAQYLAGLCAKDPAHGLGGRDNETTYHMSNTNLSPRSPRSSYYCSWAAWPQLSGLVPLRESSVRSYLVGNAGSRPISEAKQPWACLVLRWGTTGEAHVLYSLSILLPSS